MGIEAKITTKGQTTIPAEVREALGLAVWKTRSFSSERIRASLIVPRNRPASSLFGLLSEYAIPGCHHRGITRGRSARASATMSKVARLKAMPSLDRPRHKRLAPGGA